MRFLRNGLATILVAEFVRVATLRKVNRLS